MQIDTDCPSCGGVALKDSELGDDPIIYKCLVCNSILLPVTKKSKFRVYFGWIVLLVLASAFALGKLYPAVSLIFIASIMILSLVGTAYEIFEYRKRIKLKCISRT